MYNGTILHSDFRVTQGYNQSTTTNAVTAVRRPVFCGAQAAMLAYGRDSGPERFTWVESLFDLTAANDNDEGELALAA